MKFRHILEVLCLARFTKKFWTHFLDFFVQKWRCLSLGSDAFRTFSACKVCSKKLWVQFHDLCVQKRSCLLWSSDAFWMFSTCKVDRKKFWVEYQDICVQKRSGLLWSSDTSWKFSPRKVTEKVLGAFSWTLHPKMKLSAVKFRCIFDVFALPALYKMFWAHFHDLCIQKRSCLRWSSDAFWKFSACKFYRKSSGHNFSICASKNEAFCCEVQTHYGSYRLSSFIKKVLSAFSRLMRPKTKLFAVEFRQISTVLCLRVLQKKLWAQFHNLCVQKWSCLLWNSDAFWKFSACEFYRKSCRHDSTIYASKNEAVCCKVQTHFGSSLPPRFTEKFLDKFSRFMCSKTKLFAVKFRPILQPFRLQDW